MSVYYNFAVWWNEDEGIENPFIDQIGESNQCAIQTHGPVAKYWTDFTLKPLFDYKLFPHDLHYNANYLGFNIHSEKKLIEIVEKVETILKNLGLKVVHGEHGTEPIRGYAVVCVSKVETTLWKNNKSI